MALSTCLLTKTGKWRVNLNNTSDPRTGEALHYTNHALNINLYLLTSYW